MKNRNTGIVIKMEKVVLGTGELGYKILDVKALTPNKLPDLYRKSEKPYLYMRKANDLFNCGINDTLYAVNMERNITHKLTKGKIYTKEEVEAFIEHCKQAGNNLMKINRKLNYLKGEWNGKTIFRT